jgi:single-strand DNA-binding protein
MSSCYRTEREQTKLGGIQMNQISLIGRLTKASELKYTQSGTAIFKNSIAINRKFKREETDFINILAFGKTAELIANHVNKGDQLGIEGHIQTGSYEKDGQKKYTFEVVVDSITFIGGKKEQAPKYTADPSNPIKKDNDPFTGQTDVSDDDLPF